MKKSYSLDYGIERDVDRMEAVRKVVENATKPLGHADLEILASYVLYGKDENGKNAVARHEVDASNRRYKNNRTHAEREVSLEAYIENPATVQTALIPLEEKTYYKKVSTKIERPAVGEDGTEISCGDGDIPGMRDLWELIDRYQHFYDVARGKAAPETSEDLEYCGKSSYEIYRLNHMVLDMRLQQYHLKDWYKPAIRFLKIERPENQTYKWNTGSGYWLTESQWREKARSTRLRWENARRSHRFRKPPSENLEDYRTRKDERGNLEVWWAVRDTKLDFSDTDHLKKFVKNYGLLKRSFEKKFETEMWGILYDFERTLEATKPELEGLEWEVLKGELEGRSRKEIYEKLRGEVDDMLVTEARVRSAYFKGIEKLRLHFEEIKALEEADEVSAGRKKCEVCKRLLPLTDYFFARKDKVPKTFLDARKNRCRVCEKARLKAKKQKHDDLMNGFMEEYSRKRREEAQNAGTTTPPPHLS